MKPITSMSDISELGTILSVWAHPDDESFCCGGLLSWAACNGQQVVCVTATRGEAGSQDTSKWPLESLAQVRTEEMAAALDAYGIDEHYWLDFPDGGCYEVPDSEAVRKLKTIIAKVQPKTVITFGREGMTGHPDHQAVCRWTHAALIASGSAAEMYHPVISKERYTSHYRKADAKLNMFFAIEMPPTKPQSACDICLHLPESVLSRKRAAIAAMPSQMESVLESFDQTFIDGMLGTECLVRCSA